MGVVRGGGVVMSGKQSRKETNLSKSNCPWWGWWENKGGGGRKVTERLKAFKGQCKCKKGVMHQFSAYFHCLFF